MGISAYIILFFIIGIAALIFGIFYKKNKATRLVLLISGAVLLAVSIAVALFLIFILIPAM
jgi:MFS-type transporter involved in bile tolerance (Atg22 family)